MNICPAFLLWHAIVSWQIFKVICRLPFFCFFIQMAISFSSQCRWAVLIAHYLMQNVNWWIANVLFGEELACFWSSRSCSWFFLSFWKKKKMSVKNTVKIPGVEAQDKEMEELHLHCSGSKAHSVTWIIYWVLDLTSHLLSQIFIKIIASAILHSTLNDASD